MKDRELLYEGHQKRVLATEDEERILLCFKDTATAYHDIKRATITGRGALSCRISALLSEYLGKNGVPTHFISQPSDAELLCRKLEIYPIRIIVRNVAAGSIVSRLGIPKGTVFDGPVMEMTLKSDALDDPMINRGHVRALGLASDLEMETMLQLSVRVNALLQKLFERADITLVDMKLEFGHDGKGNIMLTDEIGPDVGRLWDSRDGRSMDRDRYRRDLGDIIETYQELLSRIELAL